MKYIQKVNQQIANPIIDGYLSFAKIQPWYSSAELYKGFWGRRGKHQLMDSVLLPEQQYLCCYCQRRIIDHNDADSTIEHVIRQSTPDRASMQRYFRPQFVGLNSANVCFTDDYITGASAPGQYPHKVAYHNFAIACRACNSARDHNEIDPLFLYPNIENEVYYDRKTGELTWQTDPEQVKKVPMERPTVEKVNLNNPLLRAIRTVWFYGKDHPQSKYSTPNTVTNEMQKRELVYNAFGEALDSNQEFSMEDFDIYLSLLTPQMWDITLKYAFFGTI